MMARKPMEKGLQNGPGQIRVNAYNVNYVSPSRLEFRETHGVVDDQYFMPMHIARFRERQPLGWGDTFFGKDAIRAPFAIRCKPLSDGEAEDMINHSKAECADNQPGDAMRTYAELRRRQRAAEATDEVADRLIEDNEPIFHVYMSTILRSQEKEGLGVLRSQFENRAYAGGNRARKAFADTEGAFWAASPFIAEDEFASRCMAFPMMSSTLGYLLPTSTPGLDHGHGITLGQDRYGGLVRIDVETNTEDRPNSNIFIAAESGSGKSTLAKDVILQERALYGAKVIVLGDPESEFGYFCMATGGSLSRVGRDCNISPFEPRNIGTADDADDDGSLASDLEVLAAREAALDEYVLASTIPFLKTFLQMAFKGITDDLLDYLDIALEALYADHGIMVETTFREYYAGPMTYPNMRELYEKFESLGRDYRAAAEPFGRLALAVRSAAVGHNSHMWNTRTDFDSTADFIVLDTQGLSEDPGIKQAQYYNLITWAWSQVRAQRFSGQYVRLVADEIHTVMNRNSPDAANQIGNIAKRIRKYGGGLMCITQMITELMDPEIANAGRAVIYNSAYKFFGRSSGPDAGGNLYEIQKLLSLPDDIALKLTGARKRQFVMAAGSQKIWLDVFELEKWELDMFGKGGGK